MAIMGLIVPGAARALDVTLYGFVHVDTVYMDTQQMFRDNGDRVFYVTGSKGENFNIHARQTRFGLKAAKEEDGYNLSGAVEMDFYGDESQVASNEISNGIRMRKAFVSAQRGPHVVLAGQTADVVSPLLPDTFDFSLGLYSGNIGFWRPQVRYENSSFGPFRFQASINRAYSRRENMARPDGQARIGYQSAHLDAGVSGLYGRESQTAHPLPAAGAKGSVDAGALDLKVKWGSLVFSGEAYTGENIADYFGLSGFKQKEDGGWAEIKYLQTRWSAAAGHARVKLRDGATIPLNTNLENRKTYGNVRYNLTKSLSTGLEYTYLEAIYKDQPEAKRYFANRWNWMVHYEF
ncbi:MAG TPA: hypothetical protein P5079_00330 [Elusimicrobiota bacterium]|nr:hypothetical protein [Elusimicrobiota bacterium]